MNLNIARIISKNKNIETIECVDITDDYTSIDYDIPTLIVGKKFAEEIFGKDKIKIIDKRIEKNVFWCFGKFERRDEYEKSLSKEVIQLEKINYSQDGKQILKNLNLTIKPLDKIALIGTNEIAKTALLNIISGKIKPDSGTVRIGSSVKISYYEKNNDKYFDNDKDMIDWLMQYSNIKDDQFVRGFLGRMLFSGEDVFKKVNVLSGGEKVRCMLAKLMLEKGNIILLDEPTNHLDIESITSLNEGLKRFNSAMIISTYDQEIIESVANRLIMIKQDASYVDKEIPYEEFLEKYGIE